MERWQVVKGMQKGKFVKGDMFKIFYPDGVYYAKINHLGCLVWTDEEGDEMDLVHIACSNEDSWKLI